MKTPLLALLLFVPLHPWAIGCDKSGCPSTSVALKPSAPQVAAKPTVPPATTAPAAMPHTEKPRRVSGSRPPAYLFM